MLPGAFFALPGGMLGQRLGERRTVVASLALMVVGGFVTARQPRLRRRGRRAARERRARPPVAPE